MTLLWRVVLLLCCQLAGGLLAWYAAWPISIGITQTWAPVLGVVAGSVVWLVRDLLRAERVLRWLRAGDFSDPALQTGLWGEVSDRVRGMARAGDRARREINQRLQDFLAAFQASPTGVVMLDVHGCIEWFNHAAALHFGLDAGRDLSQQICNLVRDPIFASYFASNDYVNEVRMAARHSTAAHPVSLSVHLHPYGEGRLLLTSRDITAVEQVDAMRRDFIANVSHEIRTPLTVLSGFVETLQSCALDESEREYYLGLMSQQATRMQTLVNDLLTLSRLEGSPAPATSQWLSLGETMQRLEQEAHALSGVLNPSAGRLHGLKFETADAEIGGVAQELYSAMSNLVANAIRYTPVTAEIQVRALMLSDGRLAFSVADNGPGIAPEHLPRLTERFYRVDQSRSRETGGTGLGLAIVKHVAQRHGTGLQIESTPGKGSVFTIIFPADRVRLRPMGASQRSD